MRVAPTSQVRWPSWKIQVNAPKEAPRDSALTIRAFRGSNTDLSRTPSRRYVIAAMNSSTQGRRSRTRS